MFDYSPTEDVPWFDGSLARLYDYFETAPEIWKDAGLFLKVIALCAVYCYLATCSVSLSQGGTQTGGV